MYFVHVSATDFPEMCKTSIEHVLYVYMCITKRDIGNHFLRET